MDLVKTTVVVLPSPGLLKYKDVVIPGPCVDPIPTDSAGSK
jgi:hypothetical protein